MSEHLDIYVVYASPDGYPDEYVVRRWEVRADKADPVPCDVVAHGPRLKEVLQSIPPWCARTGRFTYDDSPNAIEAWL